MKGNVIFKSVRGSGNTDWRGPAVCCHPCFGRTFAFVISLILSPRGPHSTVLIPCPSVSGWRWIFPWCIEYLWPDVSKCVSVGGSQWLGFSSSVKESSIYVWTWQRVKVYYLTGAEGENEMLKRWRKSLCAWVYVVSVSVSNGKSMRM